MAIETTETTIRSTREHPTQALVLRPGQVELSYWDVYQQRRVAHVVGPDLAPVDTRTQATWSEEDREVYERALTAAAVSAVQPEMARDARRDAARTRLDAALSELASESSAHARLLLESEVVNLCRSLGLDVRSVTTAVRQ